MSPGVASAGTGELATSNVNVKNIAVSFFVRLCGTSLVILPSEILLLKEYHMCLATAYGFFRSGGRRAGRPASGGRFAGEFGILPKAKTFVAIDKLRVLDSVKSGRLKLLRELI
jgi:hypothetical protein